MQHENFRTQDHTYATCFNAFPVFSSEQPFLHQTKITLHYVTFILHLTAMRTVAVSGAITKTQDNLGTKIYNDDKYWYILSSNATSGFRAAAFNTGPITSGKYCSKSLPMILHIRAHADIMYDI